MAQIRGPFIKFWCASCGAEVDMKINPRRALAEMERIKDGPPLVCAGCWKPGDHQQEGGTGE